MEHTAVRPRDLDQPNPLAMQPYVMIGHSAYFGDYVDAIHAVGGYLRKVVHNFPADTGQPKSLDERAADLRAWAAARNHPDRHLVVQPFDQFSPEDGDVHMLGFRSRKLVPLRDELRTRWGVEVAGLIHPAAYVSPLADIGPGVFIGAQATVAAFVTIEEHAFINRAASVGHDCRLGAFCDIGPGACLGSGIRVGRSAAVGIGAVVKEGLTLGDGCFVAGAAMVLADVPPGTLVAGVPAVVKKLIER